MSTEDRKPDPASPYTCADCFAAAASMFQPCPACGSLRVVLTSIVLAAQPEPQGSTEDRSKMPPGLQAWGDHSPHRIAWGSEHVYYDEADAIAAAWAFVDRIRQEAAAAERERLAAVLDGDAAPVEWGCEHPVSLENVAAWLRAGATGEP